MSALVTTAHLRRAVTEARDLLGRWSATNLRLILADLVVALDHTADLLDQQRPATATVAPGWVQLDSRHWFDFDTGTMIRDAADFDDQPILILNGRGGEVRLRGEARDTMRAEIAKRLAPAPHGEATA